jgi:hypothetical protein
MSRKPWETPIEYKDDRFAEPPSSPHHDPSQILGEPAPRPGEPDEDDEFGIDDEDMPETEFESADTEPMDYSRGPHDDEFGVDENAFESNDREPIDYGNGPHDDEFGIGDEDEDR